MVFHLQRIDAERNKIVLALGTYFIGKGKLLECDSKKIPFNLGTIIVSTDKLAIGALHENKLYFTEKGSNKIQVLQKSERRLKNGDSFGLLRRSYWYEVLHCTADKENQPIRVSNTDKIDISDEKNKNHENGQNDTVRKGLNTCSSSESFSSTNKFSHSKRSHSPENDERVAKMRMQSAVKIRDGSAPHAKLRERCVYGATCYILRSLRRSNGEHKAQFSHPRDADWGSDWDSERRPQCPLGWRCVRAGARHWARYAHQPGQRPPPPVPRTKANKCWHRHSALSASDSDSPVNSPKVLRSRRARPASKSANMLDNAQDSEPEDPYATEDSEDWAPTAHDFDDF